MNASETLPVIVLGGGISGLAAAGVLQQKGREFLLLEKCPTFGGLTRTVEVGEFCFDYTGHFLHLCRYSSPEDIPYANQKNEDWERITRSSYCFVGGKFVTAPIQYNLADLPPALLNVRNSYHNRPSMPNGETATFRDFVVSGFGQVLSDLFLIPQNEKTMAISLDRLSKDAARRFFPAPDENIVRDGMIPGVGARAKSYNSTFWYPKVGGIQRLVDGLRQDIKNCCVNQDVVAINLRDKSLQHQKSGHFPLGHDDFQCPAQIAVPDDE